MTAIVIRIISAIALAASLTLSLPVRAEPAAPLDVSRWTVYGSAHLFVRDAAVPGEGAVRVAPRAVPGEDWASGAVVPVAAALRAGDRVSGIFWARAERPASLPVVIQAGTEPYAVFARTVVHLTPAWRRFVVTGVAPSDLAAETQTLSVQLGKVPVEVSLGPVLLLPGAPDAARIGAAFAAFQPACLAEDVRIPSDPGVVLAGTLHTPRGHGPGPFPIAVMLAGSGPNGRGGYTPLLERLLGDGIAMLDYDKRGVGQSTGVFVDTIPLMERDAAAAIAWLRTRPDIDARRIAIAGHSQGGVVGPAVAARDPAIAAVVILAGPVGPRGELFLSEMRTRLSAGRMRAETIEPIVAAAGRLMEAYLADAPASATAALREAVVEGFVAGGFTAAQAAGAADVLERPDVLSMYDVGPNQALSRIRAPVLALYAGMDTVISTPQSVPAARAALTGNPDATVIELPGLNHVFQRARTGDVQEFRELGPPVSAPEAIALIGDWLEARLHPTPRVRP